jgi:hypothetical protein
MTNDSRPKPGDVLLLAGTNKGTFLFWSDPQRRDWHSTHHHGNWQTYHAVYDPRDNTIYAATNSSWLGSTVRRSQDLGQTWDEPGEGPSYGAESGYRVENIWHIRPGRRAGEVYAGVQRAGLFHSSDGGRSWSENSGLTRHPTTPDWQPGAGGLCLHTILLDPTSPERMYVGISAVGTWRTDDGGRTWAVKNKGVRADFMPEKYPEWGQCVHKLALHPARPERLYLQNHGGVYRSDNHGDEWQDIGQALSSDFGFSLTVHSHDPDTIYIVPLEPPGLRYPVGARMAVWRSRDAGQSWQEITDGLPSKSYTTVLREGLTADSCDPCGLYVGTKAGQIYFSRDEGEHWEILADSLPAVFSVSAHQVAS